MRHIIELSPETVAYLVEVGQRAIENGQTLKVCVDGGLKVKRGESMWTPPLGHPVDSNGQRIG